MNEILPLFTKLIIYGIPAIIAITLHEAAHGFIAEKFGDHTARWAGRISLNPFRHIDPFGTIILPATLIFTSAPFIFGYAKPVPVNFDQLRPPRKGMIAVAIAGPTVNILLAFISGLLIRLIIGWPSIYHPLLFHLLSFSLTINTTLAVFNMLPLLPLDGGRILAGILPKSLATRFTKLESLGFPILLFVLLILPLIGNKLGVDIDLVRNVVTPLTTHIIKGISKILDIF